MSNSGKVDKYFIVKSGKGGECFVYNAESGESVVLRNTEETRRLIAEETSFILHEQKYENDISTLDESFGTLVFVTNTYRLYGYVYPKKNRRTKTMELTSKFIPMECMDNYKNKLLNSSGNLIDISNEKLYSHCKVKGLYAGFTDIKGNSVETDEVNQFLQCRLNIAGNKKEQHLTEGIIQLAKEGQQADIKILLDKISQLMEREQRIDKKEEQLKEKEQILLLKEQELHDKEIELKIREENVENLNILFEPGKSDIGKVVNVSRMWPIDKDKAAALEYEKIDYMYEFQLKVASVNHTIRVPMSFYRKTTILLLKILESNREVTVYRGIIAIKFRGDKDRNVLVVTNYDEDAEFIDLLVLKEYTRFEVDQYELTKYELQYKKWREEHRINYSLETKPTHIILD